MLGHTVCVMLYCNSGCAVQLTEHCHMTLLYTCIISRNCGTRIMSCAVCLNMLSCY